MTSTTFPSATLDWLYCSLLLELIETEPRIDRLIAGLSHFASCPCHRTAVWPVAREDRQALRAYAPIWRSTATMPCVRGELDMVICYLEARRMVVFHHGLRQVWPGPMFRQRLGLPVIAAELIGILRRCLLAIQADESN